jgi:hypothetical protein
LSAIEDWVDKRDVPDLFGPHLFGMLGLDQLSKFWKRFIHVLNMGGGTYSDHTNRYYIHLEGFMRGCDFHVIIESTWNGAQFENKFQVWADKRHNYSREAFEKVIEALRAPPKGRGKGYL